MKYKNIKKKKRNETNKWNKKLNDEKNNNMSKLFDLIIKRICSRSDW